MDPYDTNYLENYDQNTDVLISKLYTFVYRDGNLTLESKELCPVFITKDENTNETCYNVLQRSVGDCLIISLNNNPTELREINHDGNDIDAVISTGPNTIINVYRNENEIIYHIVRIIDRVHYFMDETHAITHHDQKILVASNNRELNEIFKAFKALNDTIFAVPDQVEPLYH